MKQAQLLRHFSKISGISLWAMMAVGLVLLADSQWPQGDWLKTDFSALLPSGSSNPWLARANALAASSYESQLVLLVEGEDGAEVSRFLKAVGDRLLAEGYVDASFEDSEAKKWHTLSERLFPYRWSLLSQGDRESLREDPAAYLEQFRRQLYSPLGGVLAGSLQSDPSGLFRNYLEAAIPSGASALVGASIGDNVAELAAYVVFPQRHGFGGRTGLYTTYVSLKAEAQQAGLSLHATGAPLYSAFGVYSANREMSTIGLASLVLLILLLVTVLRSFSALLLTLVCVSSGLIGGLLITVSLLQQIHIITLVFGSAIIGIAADYALHYLSHSFAPGWHWEDALDKVWVGLSMGVLTSAVAFISLTLLPFPGIRQIGLFMASGLLCSFLTVCIVFPLMYRGTAARARLPRFCVTPQFSLRRCVPFLLFMGIVAIPGLMLLQARDDVREFYAVPDILREDQAVISRTLSAAPSSQFLLVQGEGIEALLEAEESVINGSEEIVRRQSGGLSGITRIVPSAATQRENFALMRNLVERGYLAAHLESLGFDPRIARELLATIPEELYLLGSDVLGGLELPFGMGGFLGCDEGECASWVRVSGPISSQALAKIVDKNPLVVLVDPIADINALLALYRVGVAKVFVAGGSIIAFLLFGIFGWRVALQIVLVPTISCVMSLALTGYIHHGYTIVNLLAMILIIGVSLDYAIFRKFTASEDQPATTLGITLSVVTSILAFGMLSFSQTPVISAFGETIAFGLMFTYMLSWVKFEWKA